MNSRSDPARQMEKQGIRMMRYGARTNKEKRGRDYICELALWYDSGGVGVMLESISDT